MLKKELKKQQAKEKKQVQTKQQTLHDEANKKKVQEAKKAIITRPKEIDALKNREESLIKLLTSINNDYKKFNKIDINTLEYKSPEHRKIVVMLRDLPIVKQQEFIQDFLEQVEQNKEVKSSAFFKDRYDKFLITETSGTINASSGVINLNPTGFWKYEIIEQASSTNLLESATGAKIENGKLKVIGTATTQTVYNPTIRKYKGYGSGSV